MTQFTFNLKMLKTSKLTYLSINRLRHWLVTLLGVIAICSPAISFANNQSSELRIEPEFWWADMHNSELQLLIYSPDIVNNTIELTRAEQVKIKRIVKTDSQNHVFVYLDLQNAQPQTLTFSIKQGDKQVNRVNYSIKSRQAGSANRQGFSNKDVIYLITPDRFVNGDPANDTHPQMLEGINREDKDGRHGGDIRGIRKALPYLANLGVTQLWINPLLENNQAKYSYHGYSTTDFYQIDPRFGSNEEYAALVAEAQQFGIGIIKDIIVNHIGSAHYWMKDFPDKNWVHGQARWQENQQDITYTSHRRTTVQDPYAADSDRVEFEQGWFTDTMPDLNQNNPHLATYLIQNSIWWVEFAGLSGIREDTYSYADKTFLTQWSTAIMNEYPQFNIVGEEWTNNPITVSYWQAGKHNKDGYVSATRSMMDFPLYETLISSLTEDEGWGSGLINLYEALANDVIYADPTQLVLFEGNHDTNRIYSLMGQDIALYKMAMAYVLTSNRIPQIFYGSEILMTSPTEGRHDGAVRSDFPGGWLDDDTNVFNKRNITPLQEDALNFITKLMQFRKNSSSIQHGSLKHYAPKEGVYVQFRHASNESLMVIYNKNKQHVELDMTRFSDDIQQFTQAKNIITAQWSEFGDKLMLEGAGVYIMKLANDK
ncbi:glycoside hydrolase family 13 protein [Shewanella maritima]|uniref:glycoside hydrolase family 13 protein n=1 Tax=Shewanella maritima TaxID=2520507 RepID=UPI003735062E